LATEFPVDDNAISAATETRGGTMTIAVGDKIPDVKVMTMTDDGPKPVQTGEVLGKGKVVLFAVPGAFTPTCSDYHLPGFVLRAEDLKGKGVDAIACIAVNDPFVMGAWAKANAVGDDIVMLADGNGDFAKAVGLELDGSGFGLGTRSQRYAAIIDNGVVTTLKVEKGPGLDVSSADSVLAEL
jgi:peroxiredoxin